MPKINPIRPHINTTKAKSKSQPTRQWQEGYTDFFAHFKKQEKILSPEYFKKAFGELKYLAFKGVIEKHKLVKDPKIKEHIRQRLNNDSHGMNYCIDLMDAYNAVKGHYSMAYGEVDEYYKTYKSINGEKEADYLSKYYDIRPSGINWIFGYLKKNNDTGSVEHFKDVINFMNDSKTEALKKYIKDYKSTEPEMTQYMYQKYYLPRLYAKVRAKCEEIQKEFGVTTFVHDEKNIGDLEQVYNELFEWKTKSEGSAKLPKTIDLSKIRHKYIRTEKQASASVNTDTQAIGLKRAESLRHELIHLNQGRLSNFDIVYNNFDEIIKFKQFREELQKAGLDSSDEAVYEDLSEFVAYAGELDCSKYSDSFKKILVELGLPEFVLRLGPKKWVLD